MSPSEPEHLGDELHIARVSKLYCMLEVGNSLVVMLGLSVAYSAHESKVGAFRMIAESPCRRIDRLVELVGLEVKAHKGTPLPLVGGVNIKGISHLLGGTCIIGYGEKISIV